MGFADAGCVCSGHDEFDESTEEIKPLTEEEKAAKLIELKQKYCTYSYPKHSPFISGQVR